MNIRFRALTTKPQQIRTAALGGAVSRFQRGWAEDTIKQFQEYPPVPGGSTYERTWQLGMGWRVLGPTNSASGLLVRIVNVATDKYGRRYMQFVQGAFQTGVHIAHGWRNVRDYLNRVQYRRALQDVINRHISTSS